MDKIELPLEEYRYITTMLIQLLANRNAELEQVVNQITRKVDDNGTDEIGKR